METITIRKRVKSSSLTIKDLEKFRNQDVIISIKPVKNNFDKEKLKQDLLSISKWDEKIEFK